VSALSRLRRIPLLVWIVVPIALAALIAWPLGGWETATLVSRTIPEYRSNQVLHTHRFDVRVDSAWITTTRHPAGYGAPEPDEVYLVVRAEITNVTQDVATASDLNRYLVPLVDGVDLSEASPESYVLTIDRTTLPELNPGLSRDLQLVWTVPADALAAGEILRIEMYDGVPSKSSLFYGLRWDMVLAGYADRTVHER
jgi:hypothetical protein